jgi:hypothetical protein
MLFFPSVIACCLYLHDCLLEKCIVSHLHLYTDYAFYKFAEFFVNNIHISVNVFIIAISEYIVNLSLSQVNANKKQ